MHIPPTGTSDALMAAHDSVLGIFLISYAANRNKEATAVAAMAQT